ncbi:MAG: FAD-binding oxidoreductase [Candidatus Methanomethylophilaceae archaeon]|nr:FAD-binding oxidoreductase [Candidatus Methanomethylophilaceae archaeon]
MKAKGEENLSRTVTPEIIASLEEAIGKENVTTSDMDRLMYSHDLAPLPKETTIAFKNIPDVVVRPKTVEGLATVMKIAFKNGVAVTPRGNSTWGLGGSMPTFGGVLVDFSSGLDSVIEIDETNLFVKVGAGCTWKKAYEACAKKGLLLGSYPSSFPAATVGGWVSTGGIGIGGYKYGAAKDNVRNMEVVLSNGKVINTGFDKLADNMAGYNLNQLFVGAEGTLGLIATVTLKLQPMGIVKPLAYEFDKLSQMGGPINAIVNHAGIKPLHIAWSDEYHFINQRKAGLHAPDVKNLFLVTLQGDEEFVALEEKVVDEIVAAAGGKKVDDSIAHNEWEERCYEFRARKVGVGAIPAEVVVPVANWAEFADRCYQAFQDMKMDTGGIIGMIADRSTAMFMPYYFMNNETPLGMLGFSFNTHLGAISAEYGGRALGLGVFFASNLSSYRDNAAIEAMKDIKTVLDPHDVMNPGHMLCGKTRFGLTLGKNLMGVAFTFLETVKKLVPKDKTFDNNVDRFEFDEIEHKKHKTRKI